jgi:two-component system, sensor histidine kinase and response regulator
MVKWITPSVLKGQEPVYDKYVHEEIINIPLLKNIDIEAGLTICDQSKIFYQKMLFLFLNKNAHFIDEFKSALNAGDWSLAKRLAHTLKGSAGNIGAHQLQSAAQELETSCSQKGEEAIIKEHLISVEDELSEVLKSLKQYQQEIKKQTREDKQTQSINKAEISIILSELKTLIEEDDIMVIDIMERLEKILPANVRNEGYQQLLDAVNQFDLDMALEKLNKLYQSLDIQYEDS